MAQKKGIFHGWGALEIGLVAVILVLCLAAGGLGVVALLGIELFESNQAGEVAEAPETDGSQPGDSSGEIQAAATPTTAPTVPGQEETSGSTTDTDATIELNTSTGSPGSTVTVVGKGWQANSRVVISLVPSDPPAYAVNSVIVQQDGTFTVDFIVPSDGRWLQESPVPIVAEAVDINVKVQASLTIVGSTDGAPAVTPVAAGIIVVGKVVVTPQPPPPSGAAQLTATANVNVRTGPGTNYDIIGVLLAGQTAEITGRNADGTWWQIKFPGASTGVGWVSAAYSSAENIGNVPIVAAPAPPPPPPPTPTPQPGVEINGWLGEYFNNKDLAGPPALVRDDPSISFDWGLGSPAPEIPVDNFSVRWTRDVYFPAGTYRFYTRTDDGVRLFIDGALLINQWKIQSPTTYAADVYLAEGNHRIQMDYYEETLGATAILSWQQANYSANWRAEYFTNQNLQGNPALIRTEPSINYNWALGSPAPGIIPVDNWSTRWTRTVYMESGDYTMQVRAKDGVRVWVDENLVIDRWADGDSGQLTYSQNVPAGYHTFRVELYNNVAEAFINFSYYRQDIQQTPPQAVIKAPSEGTVGVPVRFDGDRSKSGSAKITTYEWDFGDGKKATGKKVDYTYSNNEDYKVRLKVIDENGLSDTTSQYIKINNNPTDTTPPVAVIRVLPSPGVAGSPVTFDGAASYSLSPITDYLWDFGDGNQAAGMTLEHTYKNPGTYNVSLTVIAQNNLRSTTRVNYQVDDPLDPVDKPLAKIIAPDKGQVNQDILFDGSQSSPSDKLVSYAWNFGDGSVANAVKVTKSYDKPGTWIATLTVTDDQGNQNTTQHTTEITDAPPPDPVPSFTFSPASPTENEKVDFYGSVISARPIVNWDWDFGDGTTDSGQNVSHVYAAAGDYNVTLTVEDEDGTTGSTSQQVSVQPFVPPQPPPQPIISGPDSAVVSQTVTFKATVPLKTAAIQHYQWDFGDGTQGPDAPEVSHAYSSDGTFTVKLVLVDDQGQSSPEGTHDIDISAPQPQPLPADVPPQAVISAPPSGTVNQPVTFDGSGSTPGTNPIADVEWDFGDGNTDSGNVQTSHTYAAAGTYTVQLTLTDDQGESSTDQHDVVIADASAQPVPVPLPVPNEPVAVFDASPNPATVGEDVNFDGGFSTGDNPIIEYNWDFGDGNTGTGMGVAHAYAQPGNYLVTLTVVDDQGLSNTSPPANVEVQAGAAVQPQPQPTATPAPVQPVDTPTPVPAQPTATPIPAQPTPAPPAAAFDFAPNPATAGQPVQFDGGFSHGQIVDWIWDFGDGDITQPTTGMGVTHVYAVDGQYQVTLTVTDNAGQTDTFVQPVTVQPGAAVQPLPAPVDTPTPPPDSSGGGQSN